MYLLDTNTLIYFFKGVGRVGERLLAIPPREVAVSTITLYEIEVGLQKSKSSRTRREKLAELEEVIEVVPFGRIEAHAAAKVRAQLEAQGLPIGPLDNLIAGTAIARRAVLVTHNTDEFRRVRGLRITDWC